MATILAAVLSGLLPAWMSSRANATEVLRDGGRGNTRRGVTFISRGLVVFQIVVTCVLLIGSLLQLQSILKQQTIDYGYDTGGVMSARMGLMDGDYPTPAARKLFFDRLVQELERDPQFDGGRRSPTASAWCSPATRRSRSRASTYREDRDRPLANFEQVTGRLLRRHWAAACSRVATSTIDDLDTASRSRSSTRRSPRKHFGTESAIGRRFRTIDSTPARSPGRGARSSASSRPSGCRDRSTTPSVDDTGFYVPFYADPFGPLQTDAVHVSSSRPSSSSRAAVSGRMRWP